MTDSEWWAGSTPDAIADFLRPRASRRKLLLLACAREKLRDYSKYPRLWGLMLTDARFSQVDFMERYADGLATEEERVAILRSLLAVKGEALPDSDFEKAAWSRDVADFVACGKDLPRQVSSSAPGEEPVHYIEVHQEGLLWLLQRASYGPISLLHDIFGNPFRPVLFEKQSLLTGNVANLAEAIYTERAFDRLPILADALEDAGCTDPDILAHCRGPGPHVRGCWVVDLLTGRE